MLLAVSFAELQLGPLAEQQVAGLPGLVPHKVVGYSTEHTYYNFVVVGREEQPVVLALGHMLHTVAVVAELDWLVE